MWFTYGLPMVYLWFTYGLPMVYLWFTYGLPMVGHHRKYSRWGFPSTTRCDAASVPTDGCQWRASRRARQNHLSAAGAVPLSGGYLSSNYFMTLYAAVIYVFIYI